MKLLSKTFFLTILLTLWVGGAAAQNSKWAGNYSYNEEDLDLDWSRTSYWFQLFVTQSGGKLRGIYAEGINGAARRRFRARVTTKGNKASVYYDGCLPLTESAKEPCTETKFTKGERLFEFEEKMENGQAVIYTIWRKMNLAVRTETGKPGNKIIFFKKF